MLVKVSEIGSNILDIIQTVHRIQRSHPEPFGIEFHGEPYEMKPYLRTNNAKVIDAISAEWPNAVWEAHEETAE